MSAQPASIPQPARLLKEIELLLRNRFRFFAEIRDGVGVGSKIRAMLIWSFVALALFGAVIGSKHCPAPACEVFWTARRSREKLTIDRAAARVAPT